MISYVAYQQTVKREFQKRVSGIRLGFRSHRRATSASNEAKHRDAGNTKSVGYSIGIPMDALLLYVKVSTSTLKKRRKQQERSIAYVPPRKMMFNSKDRKEI